MGAGGFEPPKAEPTGLQPVPFGHSGTPPGPVECSQERCSVALTRMETFDAAVVGAGPAGSTTAYRLARAGARVLLVDRARFPRDKPCGGGLTIRAVRELPVDVEPVVEQVIDRMAVRLNYGSHFQRGGRRPLVLMTQRRRL